MKTIEEQAKEYAKLYMKEFNAGNPGTLDYLSLRDGYEQPMMDAFIAGAYSANEWISVDEELPKQRVDILIKRSNDYVLVKGYYLSSDNSFYNECILYPLKHVTHWRYVELELE